MRNYLTWLAAVLLFFAAAAAYSQTADKFGGDSWDDFAGGAKAVCADGDVDNDDDGLIEICYLEDLNAMRYQLDGSGRKTTSSESVMKDTTGCGANNNGSCNGYELVRDLDFDDPNSYRGLINTNWTDPVKEGWEPIGTFVLNDPSKSFTGIFEGNGHTIANLMINREDTDLVGLFGRANTLRNIGLLNVQIEGQHGVGGLVGQIGSSAALRNIGLLNIQVDGRSIVGGLTGSNSGSIINSYAMGRVSSTGSPTGSRAGGLVGSNGGTVANSYAAASVTGQGISVGGLIGENSATVTNSYATGNVEGLETFIGGLVGNNAPGKEDIIKDSYATGRAGFGLSYGGTLAITNRRLVSVLSKTSVLTIISGSDDVGGATS